MSRRSMQLTTLAPPGNLVHVWVTRVAAVAAGARQTPVLSRWPATLVHVSKEDAVKRGHVGQTLHTLVGPWWKGHTLEAGDLVARVLGPDGLNYVREDKPWSVVGRSHEHGIGDPNGMSVLCKEEV